MKKPVLKTLAALAATVGVLATGAFDAHAAGQRKVEAPQTPVEKAVLAAVESAAPEGANIGAFHKDGLYRVMARVETSIDEDGAKQSKGINGIVSHAGGKESIDFRAFDTGLSVKEDPRGMTDVKVGAFIADASQSQAPEIVAAVPSPNIEQSGFGDYYKAKASELTKQLSGALKTFSSEMAQNAIATPKASFQPSKPGSKANLPTLRM